MARFWLLLVNEFKLFRTSVPMHVVAIVQPTIMYVLMASILVHPTFDLYVTQPESPPGRELVSAMSEVGSPAGLRYIEPIVVPPAEELGDRQLITVEERNGVPTAVQRFGLIDSNLVKNLRNRLTAAVVRVWEEQLGDNAILVEEHPWLPNDVPYGVYFGMAALPLTAFLAASVMGSMLSAQEFEFGTIVEYRLAPSSVTMILGARLIRLVIGAYAATGLLVVAIGVMTGTWPDAAWRIVLAAFPVGLIGGGLGVTAGLVLRRSIPAFLIALVASFVLWLLGGAFGLAAGFSKWYEAISRIVPHTHAVELAFPAYFGTIIGRPGVSVGHLLLFSAGMLALTAVAYRLRVTRQG